MRSVLIVKKRIEVNENILVFSLLACTLPLISTNVSFLISRYIFKAFGRVRNPMGPTEKYCHNKPKIDGKLLHHTKNGLHYSASKTGSFRPPLSQATISTRIFQHSSTALSNGLSVRLNYSSMKIMVAGLTPF